jgi:hypothetical protein
MKRLSQTDLRNSSFSFIGSAKSESESEFTDESESRKRKKLHLLVGHYSGDSGDGGQPACLSISGPLAAGDKLR